MSLCQCQNTHEDALPCSNPGSRQLRLPVMGGCPGTVHRIYELSRLCLVLLTQIYVYVSLVVRAYMYARLMSLSINTLGLSPVTVADSNVSSGEVAADNPCSLPVLICFATSLNLTFMWCLSPLLRSTHFTLMGGFLVLSKRSSMGLSRTHSSLSTIPSPGQVPSSPFRDRDNVPYFLSTLAHSPPQLEHPSPRSRSCPHSPRRIRCSITPRSQRFVDANSSLVQVISHFVNPHRQC